jgi:hypothetical protein
VFCAKFFGLLVLRVRLLCLALRAQDVGQIAVGLCIARIEVDRLPVLGDRPLTNRTQTILSASTGQQSR